MRFSSPFTFVAAALLLGASPVSAQQIGAIVYEGCFPASSLYTYNSSYIWNSKGYCQGRCAPIGFATMATADSSACYCGNDLPPTSAKVSDSFCNSTCSGFGTEKCGGGSDTNGGTSYYSVYLSGLTASAPIANSSGSSDSSDTSTASSTTTSKPSTITVGASTVVVTAPGDSSKSSGGPSKAGIAAGVAIGIVAIGAIIGGLYLYMRNRRRREVEAEFRRNAAISSLVSAGKPPSSSGSHSAFTDTRLDPNVMAQRRMSDVSIADNQDYSRRILKVTNA